MMPDLAPGQWLSPKDRLAAVAGDGPAVLTAYVGEDEVERLSIGAEADFLPTAPGRATVSGTVTAIERTALHQLDVPSLASVAGGPIAVRPGDRTLTPEKALYRVRLTTTEPPPAQELVGTMHIDAAGATLVARAWRSTLGILVRESGM